MPTFSARVGAGRRAVTVPVDEISSISGLVEPGDRIDIMVTLRRDNRQLAFVLMQSVPVLATGTKVEQGSDGRDGSRRTFTTITLDVNAEQARQVIAAREIGKITALLRAPGDRGAVSASRDDAAALLGLASPAPSSPGGVCKSSMAAWRARKRLRRCPARRMRGRRLRPEVLAHHPRCTGQDSGHR